MMKKLMVLLVAILMLDGCVDQQSSEIVFTMINETDKNVLVLGYAMGVDLPNGKAENIYIEPNSDYSVTRITGIDDDTYKAFYSISVDSVRVVFNNERVKIYTLESVKNTPDASILTGERSNGNYRHTITEEDYNTAQDCDPDCETVA